MVMPHTAGRLSTFWPLRSASPFLSGESGGTRNAWRWAGYAHTAAIGTLRSMTRSSPSEPACAIWMRPGMNTSFMRPAARNAGYCTSSPRSSSSLYFCIVKRTRLPSDHSGFHATCSGHQPFDFSHSIDLAETFS